ncbi:hypothetical protein N836_13525 [Leptolyngbya sp. Heron Island J]|uniref:Uma2 family endonuclease n=1 Tax=Leptolyngbya sp. Heron Island J TaxID=1385935 RepID=UPI0003B93CEE|nr:Uma2 family endonuclease [Leptolyngbya sp. Heron Island J]ESA35137.1 hypothetical protein N836_13525 [Leptolyngbya sp. Heron Island J]
MVQYKPPISPSTETDLPETDNFPVDNELQILIPTLLRATLALAWPDRMDWFFGINLGLYYDPTKPAIGPDAFLSIGVPRYRPEQGLRLSYLLWQEGITPQWVLEIVSKTPGQEYDAKMELYAELGILYYTIFNPDYWQRDQHQPFEVYRLIDGCYRLQANTPIWMPEVGLGIGMAAGTQEGLPLRNWLYWYDEQGQPYPAPENVIAMERARTAHERQLRQQAENEANQERMLREDLLKKLRERGIDPETL